MEADWEVEIAPSAPVIEAIWTGFVDLRRFPDRISEIEETRSFPALAQALRQLNRSISSVDSQVWTSKCDVWVLEQLDPAEMDALIEESTVGLACYIDLLPRDVEIFKNFDRVEKWARSVVSQLRPVSRQCCRADLVIRHAIMSQHEGLGITAYVSACGAGPDSAQSSLNGALGALVETVAATSFASNL
jgi:hypothetical protein